MTCTECGSPICGTEIPIKRFGDERPKPLIPVWPPKLAKAIKRWSRL